jgi:hypothetical protein
MGTAGGLALTLQLHKSLLNFLLVTTKFDEKFRVGIINTMKIVYLQYFNFDEELRALIPVQFAFSSYYIEIVNHGPGMRHPTLRPFSLR